MPVVSSQMDLLEKPLLYTQLGMVSDGKASLFLRSDGQAMGGVEALDPSSVLGGQACQRGATRDRQCHALRLAQWLPLALAAS